MIICEIGQNFCGDMTLAKTLIDLARLNGGDLVKFQLYDHSVLYKDHPEIPDSSLTFEQAKELFDYGASEGIEVFFSVFDVERVNWCKKIGVKRYKIAYSQKGNKKLVEAIPKNKPIIVSADDQNFSFWSRWPEETLYCISQYPTSLKNLKFKDIPFEQMGDGLYSGFSDHTIGLDAAKIALARGAQIIEKHFAINHHTGVDAAWSMTPQELKELKEWEKTCQSVL